MKRGILGFGLGLTVILPFSAWGERPSEERWAIHAQSTFIAQGHGRFHSPYSGPNSLSADPDQENSLTATIFAGVRPWPGAEMYFSPELAAGGGLSEGTGVAGAPNGEATHIGSRQARIYAARIEIRQTIALGPAREPVEADLDQLAGIRPVDRLMVVFGKFSVMEMFDDNPYSHDPRRQFLNWGLMANAAWDYPADTRGYTWGTAAEWTTGPWSWRSGGFLEPEQANGPHLETDISRAHAVATELEHRHHLRERPGAVRLLGFWNQADMGHYRTALETQPASPDVVQTRTVGNRKYGVGLSADQELSRDVGVFLRLGWNDGHAETWAFTEVERTASLGVNIKGGSWRRPQDVAGLAGLINGLSRDHRDYLAAGGQGFLLGDGRLNYATENILEAYYAWQLWKPLTVTFDLQEISHPGYNDDRGPVTIGALRAHLEF